MPNLTGQRRNLLDPWVDLPIGGASTNNTRVRSAAYDGHGLQHPTKSEVRRMRRISDERFRKGELGSHVRILDKYEASLAGDRKQPGQPGSPSPAMDIWALALGVDIDCSKATERARRKLDLEEAGQSTDPGGWAHSIPPTTAPDRRRKRGRGVLGGGTAGGRRRPVVAEVVALDGFLSELQGRLKSVEGGAVGRGGNTIVPTPATSSSVYDGERGRSRAKLMRRDSAVAGVGDEYGGDGESSSASLADVYGIPKAFIANAEEVRSNNLGTHW